MGKIEITVGMTDKNYSAHVNVGDGIVVATGETFDELKKQMLEAIEFHLDGMREDNDEIPEIFLGELDIVYRFDPESLLQHYKGIFTNSALERLTGINQRQLQRYATGQSKPRPEQAKRISDAFNKLGRELQGVEL